MPKNIVNSLTFHGRDFAVSMLEPEDLSVPFGSPAQDQFRTGPYGRFRYAEGKYELRIDPSHIELLSYTKKRLLPKALMEAARKIVPRIAPARQSVAAVGIDCDCTFTAQEIGRKGVEFCGALTNSPFTEQFVTQPSAKVGMTTGVSIALLFDSIWYTIRLEPDADSEGDDLIVAINAYQDVQPKDALDDKVRTFTKIRSRISAIHGHLKGLQTENGE